MTSKPSAEDTVRSSGFSRLLPPEGGTTNGPPEGVTTNGPPDGGATNDFLLTAARRNEWVLLGLAVAVLAASFLLQPSDSGHLRLPGSSVELPGVCWWKRSTGVDCPGCGLSRAFVSLAHGDVAGALRYHPFGLLLFLAVVAQIPYRALKLRRLAQGRQPWSHPLLATLAWFFVAGLLMQWLLKMAGVM